MKPYAQAKPKIEPKIASVCCVLQAVAPLLTLIGPLFIFLYYIFTSTDSGISSALITIMVSAITFVNPLTTVYFVKQYRHALLRILGMDNARVHSDPKLYAATAFSGMSLPTAQ